MLEGSQLDHREAQLFRLLSSLFGKDNVVPWMRVVAVCGGSVADGVVEGDVDLPVWAENNRCLFTVIDAAGSAKMVVEFFSEFADGVVEQRELEHQMYLRPLLQFHGILYVNILPAEFEEILDPGSSFDLISFFRAKVPVDGSV